MTEKFYNNKIDLWNECHLKRGFTEHKLLLILTKLTYCLDCFVILMISGKGGFVFARTKFWVQYWWWQLLKCNKIMI